MRPHPLALMILIEAFDLSDAASAIDATSIEGGQPASPAESVRHRHDLNNDHLGDLGQ